MELKEIKIEDLLFSNKMEDDRTNTFLSLVHWPMGKPMGLFAEIESDRQMIHVGGDVLKWAETVFP